MNQEYCEACDDLNEYAYDFVENGVTTTISNRLKADHGFTAKNGDTDCASLNDANDCLIGGAGDLIEDYDVCDIKSWLYNAWDSLHTVLKAMIAAICGLWTKVHCILSGLKTLLTQLTKEDNFGADTAYAWGSGGGDSETMFGEAIDTYHDYTPTTELPPQNPTKTLNGNIWTIVGAGDPITYPSDGVAIVGGCVYLKNYSGNNSIAVLFHTDAEWDNASTTKRLEMMHTRGLHYAHYTNDSDQQLYHRAAHAFSTAMKVTAGSKLQVRIWPNSSDTTSVGISGIHQIWSVFIPNFSSALDVDKTLFDSCGE